MTNQQILEKAIQKAVDGSWLSNDVGKRERILRLYDPLQLIYSHDFAKALWPENKCLCGANIHESHGAYKYSKPGYVTVHGSVKDWKDHLQRMVVSEDPVRYLGENI